MDLEQAEGNETIDMHVFESKQNTITERKNKYEF